MVEYDIELNNRQFRFLSNNFFNLTYREPILLGYWDPDKGDRGRVTIYDNESHPKRIFDRSSRSTPLIRSLYGIVGVERMRGNNWPDFHYFHNFFIPSKNKGNVLEALHCGTFSKEFPDEDLDILSVVYERNRELRELGIRHRYPFFYVSEISDISGISREDTERGLTNLIGVLGFCIQKESKFGSNVWSHRWLVPKAREGLIEELLS